MVALASMATRGDRRPKTEVGRSMGNAMSCLDRSGFHELRPDYSRPVFVMDAETAHIIEGRLKEIYGATAAVKTLKELARLMAVYYAHKTPDMIGWEKSFVPADRFTEKDAVLITYGDLIRDERGKPLKALAELCERHLKGVFNSLHILPFFPYSSDRGFAVINFFAVDPNLGTWDDILVLKAQFQLMFDGVFNHISSRSRWFQEFLNQSPEFRDFFISYSEGSWISKEKIRKLFRPRTSDVFTTFPTLKGRRKVWTTFGPDQVDLNFENPQVLLKIVEILLNYVRRGADMIRLDAVTYLWKELGTDGVHHRRTHLIIKLLRDVLNAVAPHVALITETNVPHAENISYFGNGRDEAQMVYNFALPPLILHTFIKGDSRKLSNWAGSLRDVPEGGLFFNFLDSHDGIGIMGARGVLDEAETGALVERTLQCGGFVSYKTESDGRESPYELNITSFSMLSPVSDKESLDVRVSRYLAARSIPLALVGVPGVYLHGLLGSENDTDKVKATSVKRDINRRNLDKAGLFAALDDPESVASRVSGGISRMLRVRSGLAAFHPAAAQEVLDGGPSFFCVKRRAADGSEVLAVTNVTGRTQKLVLGGTGGGMWRDIFSEQAVEVDGEGLKFDMHAYRVAWLRRW